MLLLYLIELIQHPCTKFSSIKVVERWPMNSNSDQYIKVVVVYFLYTEFLCSHHDLPCTTTIITPQMTSPAQTSIDIFNYLFPYDIYTLLLLQKA